MRRNLRAVKRIKVEIWREDDRAITARFDYWHLRVIVTPAEGEKIGAERVLDDTQLHRAVSPAIVLDYAWEIMRKIVLSVLRTGELPDERNLGC
jgi:hypothetical protein